MIVKNLVAVCGTYKNKEGQEKNNYVTIGKYFMKDGMKESIKIENIPVGRNGRASIYEIEKKDGSNIQKKVSIADEGSLPF